MNTDFEQIIAVLFISFLVFLLFAQFPSIAMQVVTAFVSFFVSIIVYEQFIKGNNGAVFIAGRSEIARVAMVFLFFWGAVLFSSWISSIVPNLLLGYLPGGAPNYLQDFGISLLFSVLTFLGMRLIYYKNARGGPLNDSSWVLIVIVIAFFVAMYYFGWKLP